MHILELIPQSGESTLLSYTYTDGRIAITLHVPDLETTLVITAPALTVRGVDLTTLKNPLSRHCFIELIEIRTRVESLNTHYLPPTTFPVLMEHTKKGLNLVYGFRTNEAQWILTIRGSHPLLSCLVGSLDRIEVKPSDN